MNLGATLYVKNSAEAVDFYIEAFRMTLGYNAKNSDGSFLHAELIKGESGFAVGENNDAEIVRSMLAAKQPTVSLGINLDNDDELHHAYKILTAGGHILRELYSGPRNLDSEKAWNKVLSPVQGGCGSMYAMPQTEICGTVRDDSSTSLEDSFAE